MIIGENIRTARLELGMTMTELSREAGIPYRTIQDYERCVIKKPSMVNVIAIAQALGVRVEELTKPNGNENKSTGEEI